MLLGPVTFLKLGKSKDPTLDPLMLLGELLPVYVEVLRRLSASGAEWVQIDEPCLMLDLDEPTRQALREAYGMFAYALPKLKLMLTTYFGALGDNLDTALGLPVAGLHLDLVRVPEQLDDVVAGARPGLVLSLGVIDGRNIWRADLLKPARQAGTRRAPARHRSCGDRAVVLAAARPDRSRPGDRARSRAEELARLLGAEDGRTRDARDGAVARPGRGGG